MVTTQQQPDLPARHFLARVRTCLLALPSAFGLLLAALGAGGPALAQSPSSQGWSLCNETSFILEAAVGIPRQGDIEVRGWTRVRPGECALAVKAPLTREVHYVYARSAEAHRGGERSWEGAKRLCVDPKKKFEITSTPDCLSAGYGARGFRKVDISRRDAWRTRLSEPEVLNLEMARARGTQRLLADAGYDIRRLDGPFSTRIAAALARFQFDAKITRPLTEAQTIDSLESFARARSAVIGLSVCNNASRKVWAAIARRRGEDWESRGWWSIAPGACAKTIDEPLLQTGYFLHARLAPEPGQRKAMLAGAKEPFCTSEARFAVMGRLDCEKRQYDSTGFLLVQPDGRQGLRIDLRDRDFVEEELASPLIASRTVTDGPADAMADPDADKGVVKGQFRRGNPIPPVGSTVLAAPKAAAPTKAGGGTAAAAPAPTPAPAPVPAP